MITVNFRNLAFYLTAPAKRYRDDNSLTTRIKWLQFLAAPLNTLMVSFNQFRKEAIISANVTAQTASLQWYLRRKHNQNIRIYHFTDTAVYISLENDVSIIGSDCLPEYPAAEDGYIPAPLIGENSRIPGVSFMVGVPASVNADAVITDLEKYKIAGKKYNLNIV